MKITSFTDKYFKIGGTREIKITKRIAGR